MIKINRGPKPDILVEKESVWTDEYLRLRAGDSTIPQAASTRYRHPQIKEAATADTYEKCVYCESLPLHVSPGNVEHLLPKSRFPELVVRWDNLAFVCPDCNTAKGPYYHPEEPVVNPFLEEPSEFIRFAGPLVFEQPGNRRGIVTIRKLKLDRGDLVERRADHLRKIQSLLNTWALIPEGPARDELAAEISQRAEDPGEYAAATRGFLAISNFAPSGSS